MAGFSLSDVDDFWKGSRSQKKKGSRDMLRREDNGVGVYLHNNRIGFVRPDRLSVSSAGWQTRTTKDRLNKLLFNYGTSVRQKNRRWYFEKDNAREEFQDNATFQRW